MNISQIELIGQVIISVIGSFTCKELNRGGTDQADTNMAAADDDKPSFIATSKQFTWISASATINFNHF